MKIAYLVPDSAVSGGQRVIFQQAEGLARRGVTVTLVSPAPPPNWFPLKGCRWEQAEFFGPETLEASDAVVATFWTTVLPAVRTARGPVFHLSQGYEADFTFYAHQRSEIRATYALPTRKLAISPHVRSRLTEEGYGPVAFIGQVFDADEFPPLRQRSFTTPAPRILVVGTFEADVKGIREALQALQAARANGVSFRLVRVSTTPQCDEELGFGLAEEYLLSLHPAQMSATYRSTDLLVGPSHPEEGFDLPVLEALSSGLPTLLSDTPGHRHSAGAAAEYFSSGSVSSLLSALNAILSDPIRRRRLSELGPAAASRFRTEDVVDRLIEQFEQAIATRVRAS